MQSTHLEDFVLTNKKYLTFKNIYYISSSNEKIKLLTLYFFFMINGQILKTLKFYV